MGYLRKSLPDVGQSCAPASPEIDLSLPAGTLEQLVDLQQRLGDVFQLATRGCPEDTLIVACPDAARDVLSTHHADYSPHMLQGSMGLVLGRGLLISDGEVWKSQRKLMQRHFHGDAMEGLLGAVSACNARSLRWIAARQGDVVELTQVLLALSVDFNFTTLFGADAPAMLDRVGAAFLDRLTTPTQEDLRAKIVFLRDVRRVRTALAGLLAERREAGVAGVDLLGAFIRAHGRDGRSMPDELIIDEVINIFTAGHATVASALKSVWHLIVRRPPVMAAIREEARRSLDAMRSAADQVAALPYTVMCIREAMRLYPPVWIITHQATRETRVGGRRVPAGSNVFVSPYLIHRRPDVWPSPDRFDPERFAPAAVATRHSHAYLPFSVGPRNCIGDQLSLGEMALHLASTLNAFDVVPVSGEAGDFGAGFLLRHGAPMHVRFERRADAS